ncbi:MAG: alpha-D-ribose 1-methylphosphonate 5-triphosphate diphosphatase [Methylobacterium sp.]|uniref:alpha-D-ribose 1-methylphosphonate 5-triphosphate diphosphatase n=1 Tax=Methylobacterium sp. TaxID=409 RepID=UPI0025F5EBDA|nr:alpha-D-ribose 1-methylphosphonate 5-triphosphate diphosphatase [Methylobacterium sp.]MBX9932494.1 alpha-D-ribose 1-methylphosphonate 5-triphosphate diphosphatase [Methylobacterium sp.]
MSGRTEIIENARLVLADHVETGWLAMAEGRIAEIGSGRAPERGLDLHGDFLIPGLVELHTDHLESHYAPRPGVRWHPLGSVLAYDAQMAASGITTVFDSLRAGSDPDGSGLGPELEALAAAIAEARAQGLLRVEHRTHLRCELPSTDVIDTVEAFVARYAVGLISLMDHTPGQRQFRDIAKYYQYAGRSGRSLEAIQAGTALKIEQGRALNSVNRPALVALAQGRGIPLASHDDTTLDDVALSQSERVALAEFPTTREAAEASHQAGITVMMGAPNLIRGGSHSGNVAALDLAEAGLLHILSSDYVPASLLMAAFQMPERVPGIDLSAALATVTVNPARATGLDDRGRIGIGLRADLVRVRLAQQGIPVVRQVWRAGERVV